MWVAACSEDAGLDEASTSFTGILALMVLCRHKRLSGEKLIVADGVEEVKGVELAHYLAPVAIQGA